MSILPSFLNTWNKIQQGALSSIGLGGRMPEIGSYKGASETRRAGWNARLGSADSDSFLDLETLRSRSRDLIRNAPICAGALLTLQSNVIGSGLRLQPKVNARKLGLDRNQKQELEFILKDIWKEWSDSIEADSSRTQNFGGLQNLAFRTAHESGDALVLLPMFSRSGSSFQTKVQIIEADRICNPNYNIDTAILKAGVEIGELYSDPKKYHIKGSHPGDSLLYYNSRFSKWSAVDAFGKDTGRRNAWLLYERNRPGQTRGIPYFSVVLEQLKQLERYTDAELSASVIGGTFTVFVESESGQGLAPLASTPFGSPVDTVNKENDIGLDYGAVVDLAPGEKINMANPSRPNQAFGDFIRAVLEQVGVGVGIPFELLLKHFTSSYSASRAALLEAWKFFLWKRKWFSGNFCQPIYESVLTEAALQGRLNIPGFLTDPSVFKAVTEALWIGPAPGQIDPLKEAKAITEKLKTGVTSLGIEVPQITGEDWITVHEQRLEEVSERQKAGLEKSNLEQTNLD